MLFLATNVAVDYVSLIETRVVMQWMRTRTRIRQQVMLLLIDAAATYVIAGTALGLFIVFISWTLLDQPLLHDSSESLAAIRSFPMGYFVPVASLFGKLEPFKLIGPTGIFFASTFLASAWIWLVPVVGFGVRILRVIRTDGRLFAAIGLVLQAYASALFSVALLSTILTVRLHGAIDKPKPPPPTPKKESQRASSREVSGHVGSLFRGRG